jgi:hypothetical protein
MRSLLCLLIVSTAGSSQELKVSSVHAAPGGEVGIEISLESPAGIAPVTLKWDTLFPVQLVDPVGDGLELGKAAKDSGKSISCAMQKPYSYTCILFGGLKPIGSGVIAALRLKVHMDARPGATPVRVQKSEAAGADFKQFLMKDAEGSIDIR